MRRVFAFGLLLLLSRMVYCSAVVGDTLPKVRDSVSANDGIVFPVRKVGIQEMYDLRSGYLITSIEAYRRIAHHAFMVDINADNPFQQSRELGLYSKVGYTFYAKP